MGLLNKLWKYRPGLPSSGPVHDIWAISFEPTQQPLSEYPLIFLVSAGEGELLANRTGRHIQIDSNAVLRDHTSEKRFIKIDGRRLLIKELHMLPEKETPVDVNSDDDLYRVPKGIRGNTLPPQTFSAEDITLA